MDPYSTHLPLLNNLFGQITCSSIFEYGMGSFSTPLFCEKAEKVVAVEMQSIDWYEKIKNTIKTDNLDLHCMLGPTDAVTYFKSLNKFFDLVFVDGHIESRWLCINEAFSKTKIIVAHDTQQPVYQWHKIKVPAGWRSYTDRRQSPWTTVWYEDSVNLKFA